MDERANQIIGYICKQGTPLSNVAVDMGKIPSHFFETVLRNCERRKKIYYDMVPINIIQLDNGEYSLIDLESFYDIDDQLRSNLNKDVATIKPHNLLERIQNI